MTTPALMRLHAEARHARERYRLYRAKVYDSGAGSLRRLRDVERASEAAEARLRQAQHTAS